MCQSTVQEWSHARGDSESLWETKKPESWTPVSWRTQDCSWNVLLCPSGVVGQGVPLRITTGYCYLLCFCGKRVFATCSSSLWLYALLGGLLLTSEYKLSDALNKAGCRVRLYLDCLTVRPGPSRLMPPARAVNTCYFRTMRWRSDKEGGTDSGFHMHVDRRVHEQIEKSFRKQRGFCGALF